MTKHEWLTQLHRQPHSPTTSEIRAIWAYSKDQRLIPQRATIRRNCRVERIWTGYAINFVPEARGAR